MYELRSQDYEIVYQSKFPIQKFRLNNNELLCGYYIKGEIRYIIINVKDRTSRSVSSFATVVRNCYALLPTSIGVISYHKLCANAVCHRQIIMTTNSGQEVLENYIEDEMLRSPSFSNDERFFSYSTVKGIYIGIVSTKKQLFFPEGESFVYNWDNNGNMLAYSIKNGNFLVLNPSDSQRKEIKLPNEFANQRVFVAAISPKGNLIAYSMEKNIRGSAKDIFLVLQSASSNHYKVLAKKARIFDIKWSENEKYLSIAGVDKRDLFDISYGYKMRNATNHDKEIIDIDGNIIMQSSKVRLS
ncbi:MAG: hypothetical protein FD156_1103 [Nitrospirae bacterium]|nr:MAG: hypothetical protein FD156_1103 [Nitrospirota bacterium]